MTASTSNLGLGRAQAMVVRVRRLALGTRSFLAAIGSRWSAFVQSNQLGPDSERSISRHTGGRI